MIYREALVRQFLSPAQRAEARAAAEADVRALTEVDNHRRGQQLPQPRADPRGPARGSSKAA